MAIKEKITENNITTIHFVGVHQKDYTLCGHDLAGDKEYESGARTEKKVNCKMCINIVEYCKKIKRDEYSLKST